MDQYVPPLAAVTTGVVVICLCFVLRIPFFLVGLLSIAMVIYAFQDHFIQFAYQYANPTAPNVFKQNAPIFMIVIVIAVALGFLLFRFGPKAITTNAPTDVLRQQTQKSSGFFNGIGKMFSNPGHEQQYSRRRNNYDEYGRSSTYDRV